MKEFIFIDLGHDYFTVKLHKDENTQKNQGPWFINRFFLSVKSWHANFVASEAKEVASTIWVHLPELPIEFNGPQILPNGGEKLGKLVKTIICTSAALRGRYARICVQIPIGIPVKKHITIGNHK